MCGVLSRGGVIFCRVLRDSVIDVFGPSERMLFAHFIVQHQQQRSCRSQPELSL